MGFWDKVKDIAGDVVDVVDDPAKDLLANAALPGVVLYQRYGKPVVGWTGLDDVGKPNPYTPLSAQEAAAADSQYQNYIQQLQGGGAVGQAAAAQAQAPVQALPNKYGYTDRRTAAPNRYGYTDSTAVNRYGYTGETSQRPELSPVEQQYLEDISAGFDEILSQDPDPAKVANWRGIAQATMELLENSRDENGAITDQQSFDIAQAVMNRSYKDLQPHLEVLQPGWLDANIDKEDQKGYLERSEGWMKQKGAQGLGLGFEILDQLLRPSENIKRAATIGKEEGIGQGLLFAASSVADEALKATAGLGQLIPGVPNYLPSLQRGDVEGLETDKWTKILEIDDDLPDWLDTTANLVLDVIADPVTYVSFGSSAAARKALSALRIHMAQQGNQKATGFIRYIAPKILASEKLTDLEVNLLRGYLSEWRGHYQLNVAKRMLNPKARTVQEKAAAASLELAEKLRTEAQEKALKDAEKLTKKIIKKLPSGIGFGPLKVPYRKFPIIGKIGRVAKFENEVGVADFWIRNLDLNENDEIIAQAFDDMAARFERAADDIDLYNFSQAQPEEFEYWVKQVDTHFNKAVAAAKRGDNYGVAYHMSEKDKFLMMLDGSPLGIEWSTRLGDMPQVFQATRPRELKALEKVVQKPAQAWPEGRVPTKSDKVSAKTRKVLDTGTIDAAADSFRPYYQMADLADDVGIKTFKDTDLPKIQKEIYELTQKSLDARGLPDEFIVYRSGPIDDLDNVYSTTLTRSTAETFGEFDRGRAAGGVKAYIIKKKDVLVDSGIIRGTFNEEELLIRGRDLLPAEGVEAATKVTRKADPEVVAQAKGLFEAARRQRLTAEDIRRQAEDIRGGALRDSQERIDIALANLSGEARKQNQERVGKAVEALRHSEVSQKLAVRGMSDEAAELLALADEATLLSKQGYDLTTVIPQSADDVLRNIKIENYERIRGLVDADTRMKVFSHFEETRLSKFVKDFGERSNLKKYTDKIGEALVPRFELQGKLGKEAADDFRVAMAKSKGVLDNKTEQIKVRLGGKGGLHDQALAEWGGDADEMYRFFNYNLTHYSPETLDMALSTTKPKTLKALATLDDVRNEVYDGLSGAHKAAVAASRDNYMPRTMTKEFFDWARSVTDEDLAKLWEFTKANADDDYVKSLYNVVDGIRNESKVPKITKRFGEDDYEKVRTIIPPLQDLSRLNDTLAEALGKIGIDIGDLRIFEDNPFQAMALRAKSQYEAAMLDDIMQYLNTTASNQLGDSLVVHADEWSDYSGRIGIAQAKYKPSSLDPQWYVDKEIDDAMVKLASVIQDPSAIADMENAMRRLNAMWARYATLSPGFHTRNMLGNVINSYLGGLRNPIRYIEAARLQAARKGIYKQMRETGESFSKVATDRGLPESTIQMIQDMENYGVITGQIDDIFDEQMRQNWTWESLSKETDMDKLIGKAKAANAAVGPGKLTNWSRRLGHTIEHNARMALYIDSVQKGLGPDVAARHVKEHLFDYDDLTDTERKVRDKWMRFYTFTRKNTALQFHALMHTPGKINNVQKVIEAASDVLLGEDNREGYIPNWAASAGMAIRRDGHALGFDTPFFAATETVESIMAGPMWLSQQLNMPTDWMPDTFQEALMMRSAQENAGQFLGILNGVPKAIADVWYAQAIGYDPFTHAAVGSDTAGQRGGVWEHGLLYLGAVLNPFVKRLNNWAEDYELITDKDIPVFGLSEEARKKKFEQGHGDQDLWYTLGNIIAGVNWYQDSKVQRSYTFQMKRMLEDALKQLDSPLSVDDLTKAGRLDAVNRFMYVNAYGGTHYNSAQRDLEAQREQLAGLIPQEIIDWYMRRGELTEEDVAGRRAPNLARPEDELQRNIAGAKEGIAALEKLIGRPLTQDEKLNVFLGSPDGLTMSDYTDRGIIPFWDPMDPETNTFTKDAYKATPETQAAVTRQIDEYFGALGLDTGMLQRMRPTLDKIDRLRTEANAVGMTDADVINHLQGEMNRKMIAYWFGDEYLSTSRWGGLGADGEAKLMNDSRETATMYRFVHQYYFGRPPTQQELFDAVAYIELDAGGADNAFAWGYISQNPPPVKSRKNVQTKAEQAQDDLSAIQAVAAGIQGGGILPIDMPERDPRKDWEAGATASLDGLFQRNQPQVQLRPSWMPR